MTLSRSLRRAERVEDVLLALVVAAIAVLAIADILGNPGPPNRLELWIFKHLRFAAVLLISILKCAVALVPVGLVGGAFVRRGIWAALTATLLVALPGSLAGQGWDRQIATQWLELGAFVAAMLLAGARLRRWVAGPRPGLPLDAGVRWSVLAIDLMLVPMAIFVAVFVRALLFDAEQHRWEPGALAGALTVFLLGARWWQARRTPADPALLRDNFSSRP